MDKILHHEVLSRKIDHPDSRLIEDNLISQVFARPIELLVRTTTMDLYLDRPRRPRTVLYTSAFTKEMEKQTGDYHNRSQKTNCY